jgi:acetyl esterase/lipase
MSKGGQSVASNELQPIIEMMRARPSHKGFTVEQLREGLVQMFARYAPPKELVREPVRAGSVPGEWVSMPGANAHKVVFYLHGGAYVRGSVRTHLNLIAGISKSGGARVLAIDYRLGPEHPFPAAVDDAVAAYHWLLERGIPPGRIVIGGDSAGGGLALAVLLSLRDAGEPLPAGAICLSPWSDLAVEGDSIRTRAAADPMLNRDYLLDMAKMYLGDTDPKHPLASPVYADLRGLPPLLIQVGTAEVLYDDATRVAAHAMAAEVEVTFEPWAEMVHAWHLFAPVLSEGRQAIDRVGAFVRRVLG